MEASNAAYANVGFVMLLFFGIHTGVSLPFLPHEFLAFLAACGLYLANRNRVTVRVLIWFVATFVAMSAVGLLAGQSAGVSFGTELRAIANFIYDIFTGLSVYYGLLRLGRDRVRKLFWAVLLVLVIGSVLEVVGIVKPLSDGFRQAVLTQGIYDLNDRDVAMYGALRPKFFASEPANLGVSISVSFYLWFAAMHRPRRKHYLAAFILLAVALYFVRSPVVVFGAIAYALTVCITRPWKGRWKRYLSSFIPRVYAVVAFLIPGVLLGLTNVSGAPAYLTSHSMFSREIAPYYMAVQSVQSHPFFGIGLQNDDQLTNIALGVYTMPGQEDKFSYENLEGFGQNSCNAFWFTFISFGIVGSIILGIMVARLLKLLRVRVSFISLCCVACLTYWMTFGRVNSPVAWFTFFVVAAACQLRMSNDMLNSGLRAG
ncbi:O-antigen ligase family protein [Occallatibacter riparius]|uniref:Uncharacterized protein n=1 Tax=Occallatibacter riparius TaxID=1002689 RepID=A0A9J7BY81_9BACT|nr:O-antigen ligase family protein [Occallatibacter riparius]UWZ86142.1 hypothetical protein MOP44_09380 [Occallatibacter riparius]